MLSKLVRALNRRRQWYELPLPLQLLNLALLRKDLRELNLHDVPGEPPRDYPSQPPPEAVRGRMADGSWNDLSDPNMGAIGTRFARNIDPKKVVAEKPPRLYDPNPREVAQRLLARDTFKPATILNTLAAAWIQFENHNWFNHGRGAPEDVLEIPLRDDDDWPEHPMRMRRSPILAEPPGMRCPVFHNCETHWWDASQIYGSGPLTQKTLRTYNDGKLRVENGRLPEDDDIPGIDATGMKENYWTGTAMLHTLFTLEHNAICDALKKAYPQLDDQRLFELAWLANSAIIAKIHTIEWTPGILPAKALQIGMSSNWWGFLGEAVKKRVGRIGDNELLSGIMGSPKDHHGAPFQLTEEFVSVYRMHPLIPDDWRFFSSASGELLEERTFTEIQGRDTRGFMDRVALPDLFYSFGVQHPGAVCLHNYPRALMRFQRIDGELTDLATLDIVKDRERGVPRYNDFREELRMPRVRSFEELTSNRTWAQEIREVYRNDIDSVDLMVGMYAEDPPPGFGFSDTAFRIFILMASRRLKSDRFFTDDFRPEVYTQVGYDWVNNTTMRDVLLRHYPELAPALEGVKNPFAPWNLVGTGLATGADGRATAARRAPVGAAAGNGR
jgi:hypothetical protein